MAGETATPTERPAGRPGRLRSLRLGERAAAVAEAFPLGLGVLVVAGLLLRLVLTYVYHPAALAFADSTSYVTMADSGLFADPARPSGYSMFLRAAHVFSDDLDVTIAIQHLIGIATGVLLYLAVRRVGAPRWAALVAGAAVLLSLDQVYLEHTIASETVFTLLLAAGLYCGVRVLGDGRTLRGPVTTRHLWLLAAGLLLGLSVWVRTLSVAVIPFLALWALFAIPGAWRPRVVRAAVAAVPAIAVVLLYCALNQGASGTFGLTGVGGWSTYSRAAPFADCNQFDPPAGTEALCQQKDPEKRPGADFYTWQPRSPARKLFGYPPAGNELLGEFGRRAIIHQPIDFAKSSITNFARFFAPGINARQLYGGSDYTQLAIDRRDPPIEQAVLGYITPYYPDESLEVSGAADTLTDAQQLLRVHPIVLLQALVLAGFGIWAASGLVRWTIVLSGGIGLLLIAFPAVTATYSARYAIPADGPLIAAGVLGLWALLGRLRGRRETREAS